MADLLIIPTYRDNYGRDVLDATPDNPIRMRLYCWPCDALHEFDLAEVEQIVQGLGEEAVRALGQREDSAGRFQDDIRDTDRCLRTVLAGANVSAHVEASIGRREQADG